MMDELTDCDGDYATSDVELDLVNLDDILGLDLARDHLIHHVWLRMHHEVGNPEDPWSYKQ
jgi:hypothetical protein